MKNRPKSPAREEYEREGRELKRLEDGIAFLQTLGTRIFPKDFPKDAIEVAVVKWTPEDEAEFQKSYVSKMKVGSEGREFEP